MYHHSPMVAPVARSLATDPDLERRVVEEGKRLLAAARGEAEGARAGGPMPRAAPGAGHGGRGFRVQALRFVDVLPGLTDRTRHERGRDAGLHMAHAEGDERERKAFLAEVLVEMAGPSSSAAGSRPSSC
jgi:hypothetical protein